MYKLNVSYVWDLIKADDCILIIFQEAGCHGHNAHRLERQWMNNNGTARKVEQTQRNQQTVFVKSPQSDPDFRDAGWLVKFDAGHLNV